MRATTESHKDLTNTYTCMLSAKACLECKSKPEVLLKPLLRTAMQPIFRAKRERAMAAAKTGMPPYRAVLSETAMPLADMLRMRRPCMLGILSRV